MGVHEEVQKEILRVLQDKIVCNVSAMAGSYTVPEIAREILIEEGGED